MFQSLMSLIMTLSFSVICQAGIDDFGAVLAENEKIQSELTHTLQKQLETRDLGKAQKPDFHRVGEDVIGRDGENVVAVETTTLEKTNKKSKSLDVEKKSFKRLSQELKDAK